MKTVHLPSGEIIPALGIGRWVMGTLQAKLPPELRAELDILFPRPRGPTPLDML
jgi:hypothetical protein